MIPGTQTWHRKLQFKHLKFKWFYLINAREQIFLCCEQVFCCWKIKDQFSLKMCSDSFTFYSQQNDVRYNHVVFLSFLLSFCCHTSLFNCFLYIFLYLYLYFFFIFYVCYWCKSVSVICYVSIFFLFLVPWVVDF